MRNVNIVRLFSLNFKLFCQRKTGHFEKAGHCEEARSQRDKLRRGSIACEHKLIPTFVEMTKPGVLVMTQSPSQ